jgi:hypothetical protein
VAHHHRTDESSQPQIPSAKRMPSQSKKRNIDEKAAKSPINITDNDQADASRSNKSKRRGSPELDQVAAKASKKAAKAVRDDNETSKTSTKKKYTASTSKKKKELAPEVADEDAEVISQDQPRKKKRKIGRHQNSQMGTFDFGGVRHPRFDSNYPSNIMSRVKLVAL